MAEVIPLFPLGTVLFPGLVLPLTVFEDRYKELVADLEHLPEDSRRFGVVTIRAGWEVGEHGVSALYGVGTAARVRTVRPTEDDCFELVTLGERRFRLLSIDTVSKPYLQAEVEWLSEPEADDSAALVAPAVADAFVEYVCDLAQKKAALQRAQQNAENAENAAEAGVDVAEGAGGPDATGGAVQAETATPREPPPVPVPMCDVRMPDDTRTLSYMVAASVPLDLADQQGLLEEATVTDRLRAELRLIRRERVLLAELGSVPAPLARFATRMSPN